MQAINWQQFGLRQNPYDTSPLIEGGELPIESAFVGRGHEVNFLNDLFESEKRLCLTICGDVGVGKTSLANFHKYMWKYKDKRGRKRLFSFRREVEACKDILNKKNFLIEVIGSVLREIKLIDPELFKKGNILDQLDQLLDLTQKFSISADINLVGLGLGFGKEIDRMQPAALSITVLEKYFLDLLDFIRNEEIKGVCYEGLIIHVNNFDIVLSDKETKEQVIKFFNEIRDLLQTSNTYFLFLGPRNFFKDIINSQKRVKSVFYQSPLLVNALTKKETIKAFEERMKLLQSKKVSSYMKPVSDEVIYHLYDLYKGDIRSIMSALRDILGQYSERSITRSLSIQEAMILLAKERWQRIEEVIQLTDEQKEILKYFLKSDKFISQKEVAEKFDKAQANVSGYYFKPLRDHNIIEEKEIVNGTAYYGLTLDYEPLKSLKEFQERHTKQALYEEFEQLNLFACGHSVNSS